MDKIFLYNHGGSENHGCEALVRTVGALLGGEKPIFLFSEVPQQDFHYGLHRAARILPAMKAVSRFSPAFFKAYLHMKRTSDYFPMDVLPYLESIRSFKRGQVEISVGGDIYCYEDYPKFIRLHRLICRRGCRTVLLGCSLDETLFLDPIFLEDMKRYDYISARESLTYGLLQNAGLTNIGLAPDSAFTLPTELLPLPEAFLEGNTVGINVSPLVARKEAAPGIVYENFRQLICSVLDQTDCAVALIPHVVWESNDDRTILKQLYEEFRETDRVVLIEDANCMQLKGYISRCRFFIGARTHATIAAYSTGVPTMVVGYSIKSRGIAVDLFGTDKNYVIPVQDLKEPADLSCAFDWLRRNETPVREKLAAVMPTYIERARAVKGQIDQALGGVL